VTLHGKFKNRQNVLLQTIFKITELFIFMLVIHFAKAQEPHNANIGFDTSQNKAVNLTRQIVTSVKIVW
jgi:hypothetical protein